MENAVRVVVEKVTRVNGGRTLLLHARATRTGNGVKLTLELEPPLADSERERARWKLALGQIGTKVRGSKLPPVGPGTFSGKTMWAVRAGGGWDFAPKPGLFARVFHHA